MLGFGIFDEEGGDGHVNLQQNAQHYSDISDEDNVFEEAKIGWVINFVVGKDMVICFLSGCIIFLY